MTGRSEVSCNDGTSAVAVADALLAITKDTPAAPNAGKAILRFRFEARFACAIVDPPMPASRL